MPFTPSHAVAILPFLRTPLPAAALVVGSMAPDLQYFVPLGLSRSLSHSWPGILYIDLPIGIVALALWVLVLRAPVLDYAPRWLRERMPSPVRPRNRLVYAALVVAALEVGVLTHLVLDFPTHAGWLSEQWPWMRDSAGPFTIVRILHFSFSVIGAAIIALWVRRWVQRTPRVAAASLVGDRERLAVWGVVGVTLVAVCLALAKAGLDAGGRLFDGTLWFYAFCTAVGVAFAFAVVICVVWWVRSRDARRRVNPSRAAILGE